MPEIISLFLHVACFLPCFVQISFKLPDSLRVSENALICCYFGRFSLINCRMSTSLFMLIPSFKLSFHSIEFNFHPALLFSDAVSYLIFHLAPPNFLFITKLMILLVKSSLHSLFKCLFSLGTFQFHTPTFFFDPLLHFLFALNFMFILSAILYSRLVCKVCFEKLCLFNHLFFKLKSKLFANYILMISHFTSESFFLFFELPRKLIFNEFSVILFLFRHISEFTLVFVTRALTSLCFPNRENRCLFLISFKVITASS